MWLFLDTSERGRVRYALIPRDGSIRIFNRAIERGKALASLASFLAPKKAKTLAGICVVEGPGSFSNIRVGVLTANLLSRLLRKSLFSLKKEQSNDLEALRDALASGRLRSRSYVAPVYDQEPNITCPT